MAVPLIRSIIAANSSGPVTPPATSSVIPEDGDPAAGGAEGGEGGIQGSDQSGLAVTSPSSSATHGTVQSSGSTSGATISPIGLGLPAAWSA